jgi:hypothetical protein
MVPSSVIEDESKEGFACSDGRSLFTNAVEKGYRYIFSRGILKCVFTQSQELEIEITVYKETVVVDEKVKALNDLLDKTLYQGKGEESIMEKVRVEFLNTEYSVLKREAEMEILEAQAFTGGVMVGRSILAFQIPGPPPRYITGTRIIDANSSLTGIDTYPFNYGVRVRYCHSLTDDGSALDVFYCLANDECRRKQTKIKLSVSNQPAARTPLIQKGVFVKNEDRVEHHLRDRHWHTLIQRKHI